MSEFDYFKIIIDQGVIAFLFVMIVMLFIWKGLPYIVKRIDEVEKRHRDEIKEERENFQRSFDAQRRTFEESMDKVIITFNSQIQKSNDLHEKHANGLQEIKTLLKSKDIR